MSSVIPVRPSRRSLLIALAGGTAAVVLGACEGDPQRTPVLPEPTGTVLPDDPDTWPPDSELLLVVRERVHALREYAAGSGPQDELTREVFAQWGLQQERLETLITVGGVPLPELAPVRLAADDAAATSGGPDDAAATSAAPRRAPLATVVRDGFPELVELVAQASPTNLPMLTSLASAHAVAAEQLGARVAWEPLTGPPGAAAVPILAALRPAIFGLEVLSARSRGEERADYETVLGEVRSLTRQLTTLAGEAAPVAPMGYDLPEPLESARQRRRLSRALVADIAPAALSTVDRVRGEVDHLTSVARVVSSAALWGARLNAQPEPFPGMTLP